MAAVAGSELTWSMGSVPRKQSYYAERRRINNASKNGNKIVVTVFC